MAFEAQEQINSLILEPYPEHIDHLAETMSADETSTFRINGTMTVGEWATVQQA